MRPPLDESEPHASVEADTETSVSAGNVAFQHAELLDASLRLTQQIAALIIEGGDLYSPSVRNLARRLADNSAAVAQSLRAIDPQAEGGRRV
jgi:hypothetical protein